MKKVDLHLHTNLSDGIKTPEEVIKEAKKEGCNLISITDHEVITDYKELSKKYKIDIVTGIEFNTKETNLHLIGYRIKDLLKLKKIVEQLRKENEVKCIETIEKLNKIGCDITTKKVIDYLEEIGLDTQIIDKRKLVKYLIYKNYASNVMDAYDKLIGQKAKCYVPNKKIDPVEIIEIIKECGGIPVLAHPKTLKMTKEEQIKKITELKNNGLEGLETANLKFQEERDNELENIANKLNLIKTFGSDFHENEKIGIEIQDENYEILVRKLIK